MIKKFDEFVKTNEAIVKDNIFEFEQGPIRNISETTYEDIVEILGKDKFSMPYDESDALRSIYNEMNFEDAKSSLMKKFGDVQISINPGAPWMLEVRVEDEEFRKAHKEYCDRKAAWCAKYGCD